MAQLWPKRNLLGEATRPQSCIPIHIHWRRAPALTPLHSPNTWAQFTKCCCENSINILRPSCGKPKILYVELLGPGYVASAFIVALTGRHSIVSFVCAYLPEPSIRGPPHTHTQREDNGNLEDRTWNNKVYRRSKHNVNLKGTCPLALAHDSKIITERNRIWVEEALVMHRLGNGNWHSTK